MSPSPGLIDRLERFWSEEKSLTALLVVLIVRILLVESVAHVFPVGAVIVSLAFSLILLAGLLNLMRQPALRGLSSLLVGGALATHWLANLFPDLGLGALDAFLMASSLLVISVVVLVQVNRSGPVRGHRIRGAVAAYLLLAALFGFAYEFLERVAPGSFQISGRTATHARAHAETFLYFSLVTLTTLGFGDITAVHPTARALVVLEAVIGQLYPAILIARLVTLEIETRRANIPRKDRADDR